MPPKRKHAPKEAVLIDPALKESLKKDFTLAVKLLGTPHWSAEQQATLELQTQEFQTKVAEAKKDQTLIDQANKLLNAIETRKDSGNNGKTHTNKASVTKHWEPTYDRIHANLKSGQGVHGDLKRLVLFFIPQSHIDSIKAEPQAQNLNKKQKKDNTQEATEASTPTRKTSVAQKDSSPENSGPQASAAPSTPATEVQSPKSSGTTQGAIPIAQQRSASPNNNREMLRSLALSFSENRPLTLALQTFWDSQSSAMQTRFKEELSKSQLASKQREQAVEQSMQGQMPKTKLSAQNFAKVADAGSRAFVAQLARMPNPLDREIVSSPVSVSQPPRAESLGTSSANHRENNPHDLQSLKLGHMPPSKLGARDFENFSGLSSQAFVAQFAGLQRADRLPQNTPPSPGRTQGL